nr:sensor histidine kinase [Bdellovibrionales bacterium]
FVNLLNNAIKYGDNKTVILSMTSASEEIIITVKDNGKGIPLEFQKKIFDKFERGRQDSNISGLGLGLFISKEIIAAHGGKIEVESRAEGGSEFKVTLKKKINTNSLK